MESTDFSNMVTTDAARASFITTSIAYLKKHKFDGLGNSIFLMILKLLSYIVSKKILDLDWEYPCMF